MSITKYIQDLKESKNISYMQLAKDIGITYQNIMDYKNDRIAFVSPNVLKKLSLYEHRKQEDILFDILISDLDESFSKDSLRYLCHMNVLGYSLTIYPSFHDKFGFGSIEFEGLLQKKRISNHYIIVDSWDRIKREHQRQFDVKVQEDFERKGTSYFFFNEHLYIANIIAWACQRISITCTDSIKEYHIVYDENKDGFEIGNAKEYMPLIKGINISFIDCSRFSK